MMIHAGQYTVSYNRPYLEVQEKQVQLKRAVNLSFCVLHSSLHAANFVCSCMSAIRNQSDTFEA